MKAQRVFSLDVDVKDPVRASLFALVRGPLEKLMSLDELERLYAVARNEQDFLTGSLKALRVEVEVSATDLARIPRAGAVMVVANHPFGGIEGIVLAQLLKRVRQDVRVMANYMLGRLPEMRDLIIPVDPFETKASMARNLKPLRDTMQWLHDGGALGVFPAGEVSHLNSSLRVEDPAWSASIGRIARKRGAPVLPVYFDGELGPLFQLAGLVHPRFRTALLPRELAKFTDRTIKVRIGKLVPASAFAAYPNDDELIEYLRLRTYMLKNRPVAASKPAFITPRVEVPIAPAGDAQLMRAEVDALADKKLLASGDLAVYAAKAARMPNVLYEIGRQREITFREAKEGTGKALDLDRFDEHYVHLFVWNHATSEVVGAYRLGQTDKIVPRFGKEGLYTHTLFAYDDDLLVRMGPALEMGRSFVRSSYQRAYASLLLLWKGIGQYVVRHPHYRTLFGPVSINNAYSSVSRQLIATFLTSNETIPELARLVKARTPLKARPDVLGTSRVVKDIDQFSDLISELEADQKGIPILLKQYLKLGGKLLGFNVDAEFGDVLDGLILVNLDQTDERILEKYLGGKEQAAAFVGYDA